MNPILEKLPRHRMHEVAAVLTRAFQDDPLAVFYFPMSNSIIDEIKNRHLPYEIDMLRGTFKQLKEIDDNGGVPETASIGQKVVRNALIEAFCVHARSLIDFLTNRSDPKAGDDATAAEFAPNFASNLDVNVEPLKSIRTKLNKESFHLTKKRPDTGQLDVSTDGIKLLELLEADIKRFKSELDKGDSVFKYVIPPLENIPALRFRTSTTSTSSELTILGIGVVNFAPHRASITRCVGCPVSSSSQCRRGYS
jgi:hypothetical protein